MTATDIPTVVGASGLQPLAPVDVRNQIVARAKQLSPGLTDNLPGILIEDIVSTDVAAAALMDSARVDLVDSVTPRGANAWLLAQLGVLFGVPPQRAVNTTVPLIFSGPPGFVVRKGFLVSDGLYQYSVKSGGVIGASGQSDKLAGVALSAGYWAVPTNTVTQIVSSVPSAIALSVTNPTAGVPGQLNQSEADHRAQLLRAGLASGVGIPAYARTQLQNVAGVDPRLIAVRQNATGGWSVIVGGGDEYEVAAAILRGFADISTLQGSVLQVANITSAANAIVTTALNHGYINGQTVKVTGIASGMLGINNVPLTVTVLDEKRFSTGVNSTLLGTYTTGGVLSPNPRNNLVTLRDYPDTYNVPFISPPSQDVAISVAWNTNLPNYVNSGVVGQLAAPAIAQYVNSIYAAQPMNLYALERAFIDAVAPVLPREAVSRLVFAVSINGIGTLPDAGTGLIEGDPESYFITDVDGLDVTVTQG